nr:hypothetical protein [Streptomyces sp. SID8356]
MTIHAAPLVLPVGAAAVADGAVVVDGDRIAAIGPYEEVAAAYPAARVRRWPGLLTPGLRQDRARALLTRCYHPDPREADALGERPLWGEGFERIAATMDTARRAGSVRRGLQRMLRHGTTQVVGPFDAEEPALRTALARSGLTVVGPSAPAPSGTADPDPSEPGGNLDPSAPGGDLDPSAYGGDLDPSAPGGDLDPFAYGGDLAATVHGPLTVGGRADLAVFDVPDEEALRTGGADRCVATVLAGRLVHRAR